MKLVLSVFLLLFVSTSCNYIDRESIEGNGQIVKSAVKTASFSAVDVSGAIDLRLRQGTAHSVEVETDQNLSDHVEIYVEDDVLVIRPEGGYSLDPTRSVVVYAVAPRISSIEVSGASSVVSEGLLSGPGAITIFSSGASKADIDVNFQTVEVDVSGSSDINVRGKAVQLLIEGSGASEINGEQLLAENADVDVSGATRVKLNASKTLKAEASGASRVSYNGNPSVTKSSSGASEISQNN